MSATDDSVLDRPLPSPEHERIGCTDGPIYFLLRAGTIVTAHSYRDALRSFALEKRWPQKLIWKCLLSDESFSSWKSMYSCTSVLLQAKNLGKPADMKCKCVLEDKDANLSARHGSLQGRQTRGCRKGGEKLEQKGGGEGPHGNLFVSQVCPHGKRMSRLHLDIRQKPYWSQLGDILRKVSE